MVITYNDVTGLKTAEERSRHLASFPQFNPNPVIEVDRSANVTFSNPATRMVLEDLGMDTGNVKVFLPADLSSILDDWDKKSSLSLYREIVIKDRFFGESVYLNPQFDVARIYAYDITERKRAEEALRESEQRVSLKLDSILSPEGDIGNLELGDIIDAPAIQSLMDQFYELAHIPMAIIDLKGKVLVGVGWQEICTKFHRVHPETCRHCIESDTQLTAGVPPGEFRLYKCKNNMWDVATPIMVGGRHVGNLFTGQFFFDDESPDYEFFRQQARQYGFDEQKYLAALDKVPRLSRATVDTVMAFFMKLSGMISQLSYSNIKLARILTERDLLMASLRESEARLIRSQEIAHLGSWELDLVNNVLTWSDEVYRIFGLQPQEFGATYEAFLDRVHPDDRSAVDAAYSGSIRDGKDSYEIEHRVVRKSTNEVRIVHERCQHLRDESGRIIRSVGMVHDITERKQAEEALKESESRYHSLFDNMTEGYAYCKMLFDNNGHPLDFVFLEANNSFGRLTGLADVIGKKVSEVIPGIRKTDPELFRIYGRVALTCKPERFEFYVEALKNWFSISVYCPQKEYFVAVFDVITERKRAEEALRESEEQFRTLADTIPNLAWWANADGYITWYNRRWYEYTGTTPQQMEGWGWQSVHDPQALPAVLERWKASIATGEPFDMDLPAARGRWGVPPVPDPRPAGEGCGQGRVVRWFGTNTDVPG